MSSAETQHNLGSNGQAETDSAEEISPLLPGVEIIYVTSNNQLIIPETALGTQRVEVDLRGLQQLE
jgi:hypothetical protein